MSAEHDTPAEDKEFQATELDPSAVEPTAAETSGGYDGKEIKRLMIKDSHRRIEDNTALLRAEEAKPEGEKSEKEIAFYKRQIEAGHKILDSYGAEESDGEDVAA